MPRALVYLLYNLLLPLMLLLGLPSFLIKGFRRGGLARNFRQRLGVFSPETKQRFAGSRPIWIHAVSVGEVFVALKIVEGIREASPDVAIVLSTTTTTGYCVAAERESSLLTVIHNPVDLPFVTSKVIAEIDPACLVLIEAEIWPNLVRQLKKRGTPVLLMNARLSNRSEARYQKVLPLIAPVFSLLDGVTVPFEVDRKRWANLGIPTDRIERLGSVKFDQGKSALQDSIIADLKNWLASTGFPEDGRILLGGSTHPGEEALLFKAWESLREDHPDLQLVVIPRHAERGGEIVKELKDLGANPILRIEDQETEAEKSDPTVWIANTTGELRSWYEIADVVFVGKSISAHGGQNPVEPVLAGKPVVVGPNMENFKDVVTDLLEAKGILQVDRREDLVASFAKLLANPELGSKMASRGSDAMAKHKGATMRNVRFILDRVDFTRR